MKKQPTAYNSIYRSGTIATTFGSSSLPTSHNWLASQVLGVAGYSEMALWCKYKAAAAGGQAQVLVLGSALSGSPSYTSDDWYELPTLIEGTPTALTGNFPAGTNFSSSHAAAGNASVYGRAISLPTGSVSTSEIRQMVPYDVSNCLYVVVLAHEKGSAGSPGTLDLKANFKID